MKTLLGGVGLVSSDHLDEAKAARLLGMRVAHDVALLDLAVLLEQTSDLLLAQAGVDASDEEVGAGVAAAILSTRLGGRTAVFPSAAARIHRGKARASHTGYREHRERRCGRESPRCRDDQRAATCCGHGRSHGAHLRVGQQTLQHEAQRARRRGWEQTIVGALVLLVLHGGHDDGSIGRWRSGVECPGWARNFGLLNVREPDLSSSALVVQANLHRARCSAASYKGGDRVGERREGRVFVSRVRG